MRYFRCQKVVIIQVIEQAAQDTNRRSDKVIKKSCLIVQKLPIF